MGKEKSTYYLERLYQAFLKEPDLVFESETELIKEINDKIIDFTDRVNNDYLVNGNFYYRNKKGVLDDREYIEEFISSFFEPHSSSISNIRSWTLDVIPFIYSDLTWVSEKKIESVLEHGYRLRNSSYLSRVDHWDLKLQDGLARIEKLFE